MCRMFVYSGKPIKPETLLFETDNSLMTQTYSPKLTSTKNLAGFGMAAWSQQLLTSEEPLIYKTKQLGAYDKNLYSLSAKFPCEHLLAHVRGTPLTHKHVAIENNSHPFKYANTNLCFAHNGVLTGFSRLKQELVKYIKPEMLDQISGTTDSEWMYALFLSQLSNIDASVSINELSDAFLNMLKLLRFLRKKCGIETASPMNIFISDGVRTLGSRFVFDFGHYQENLEQGGSYYNSLWFTFGYEYHASGKKHAMSLGAGKIESVLLASEPLTIDTSTWLELPEYTLITVDKTKDGLSICSHDIDL